MNHRLSAVFVIAVLVASACSRDGASDDEPAASDESASTQSADAEPEVDPTVEADPEPTTVPEPEPTAEPEAEPEEPEPEPVAACVAPVGVTEMSITLAGDTHDVRFFVPEAAVSGANPVPTVLNWHGLGSNGSQQAAYTNYEALAEAEGFVVVHPTGIDNSWELIEAQDPNRTDLAFADALIDEVIANWCADSSRIYSTGMSNGGYFTARLVCELGDRIAAAVSVAATFHPSDCEPARPVPYAAFHGTADGTVPFDGSGESSLADPDNPAIVELLSQAIPNEFAEFTVDAACDVEPQVVDVSDEVIRYDYTGCVDNIPMTFYEITGGGHQWPGSPLGGVLEARLGYSTNDISATADGWIFVSQHTL